ncbi:MAG: SGNH/GDSL hydrolase family protein [Bifidobacterium scardovii]|jgi:lysophospholipase L1-like esterase|uniref:SGNH/GDSL hydrolase family protein n=1 Tax=Bifidobacterium scardovii TaxID=158787 RepID=UPI0020618935|nr:SGNH/GDSL hydrolase family protein [Bifidobacterium scardovii]MDU2421311.1 SGNH/GDSL hydrolase family protein [Bifidobacterium scardovii]DAZ29415.1 MAG TPA: hypothetical protein [Caudoviricetes sp.]
MSEQITDIIESVMPGPRGQQGPEGPRGLPGVNAMPADEAVAAYIDALDSKSHASVLTAVRGGHLVAFGDSITRGGQTGVTLRYATRVANVLGLVEHNYAVSGSAFGFARDTIPPIGAQLDAAKADTAYDPARVGLVLVGGGVNDRTATSPDESVKGLNSLLSGILAQYPNALIVFNCCQGGLPFRKYGNDAYMDIYERLYHAGAQFPRVNALPAWRILWPYKPTDVLQTDGVHPTQAGHNILAAGILSALGSGRYPCSRPTIRFSAAKTDDALTPVFGDQYFPAELLASKSINSVFGRASLDDDGTVHLQIGVMIAPDAGNLTLPILNLPHWAVQTGMPYATGLISALDATNPNNPVEYVSGYTLKPGDLDTANMTGQLVLAINTRHPVANVSPTITLHLAYPTGH